MTSLASSLTGKRTLIWFLLVPPAVLVGTIVWFNSYFYPGYGLGGIGRDQYQSALLKVGEGFAASESLTLSSLLKSQHRSSGKRAHAWGVLRLSTPKGGEVHLWVSISWSPSRNRWQREDCTWLGDPRDRLFFAESLLELGNWKRIYYSLEHYGREELRRLREVRGR